LKGNRHIWIWQCHEIYGATFRFRPDGLLTNSPTGHYSIYNAKANVTKGTFYKVFRRYINEINTWNATDNGMHARKRRVLNHVFSENALRSAEKFVIQHVTRWCQILGENAENEWSEPFDFGHEVESVICDIITDLCFGKSTEIKEPGESELKAVPTFLTDTSRFLFNIASSPYANLLVWLKPWGVDSLMNALCPQGMKSFHRWLDTSVTERTQLEEEVRQQGSDQKAARKDMFHYIFQAKDPETGQLAYTQAELVGEAYLLFSAGTDTSNTNLAATMFYLTRHPRVYARLAQEIRTTFDTVDEIRSGTKLGSCRYLRACLDEALRTSPSAPSDLIREVLPGGLEMDGMMVPEGTLVGTCIYAFHHNQSVFPDPFVYRPERWIVDEKAGVTAADVARAESAFSPFSRGATACVGKNLAYLMLNITMARLLYLFDFKVPDGNTVGEGAPELMWGRRVKNQFQVADSFVAKNQGPMVQVRKRHT
jgi:cytochrome P450